MLQSEDRVHFTHLKNMSDSPAHVLTSMEEGFESASFAAGRLVHFLTFGIGPHVEGVSDGPWVVYDATDRRIGKVWDAFKAQHEGRDIYKPGEVEEASRIANAVRSDPVVQRLGLLEGEHELMLDWEYFGTPFRSHLDCLGKATRGPRKGRRHLWDLKTTTSAKPEKFHWEARRYHYPAQLATYEDAARTALRQTVDDAYIVAVEKGAPYCVVVYEVDAALREEGRRLVRGWLERYNVCKATGVWPGYVQDVVPMGVLAAGAEELGAPVTLIMEDGSPLLLGGARS